MRILIAVHGYPPTHSAGAERRAERMAQWFVENNHYLEVCAVESLTSPEFSVESREQNGVLIHRLSYNIREVLDPLVNSYDYPQLGDAIQEILERGEFDLIHIISGYLLGSQAVRAAEAVGIPTVITLTEFWFMCARLNLIQANGTLCNGPESYDKCVRCLMEEKRRYRLPALVAPKVMDLIWPVMHRTTSKHMHEAVRRRDIILRKTLEAIDLVICPSNYLIHKFSEFGFQTDDFRYIRQGLAHPRSSRSTYEPALDVLSLGYVGQIMEHKGVDLLIDAVIPLLKNGAPLILEIWGSETQSPEYVHLLKRRTARFSANIRWQGKYLGDKVWDVLAQIDVLVVPSRWHENSPNAILEAFEIGVPVIATNLGGMSELVDHEKSGLLFEYENAKDLRRQIERLLHEPGLLDRLRQGVPQVKTVDEEMQEIMAEYKKLIHNASTT